jgi:acyl carrier protein
MLSLLPPRQTPPVINLLMEIKLTQPISAERATMKGRDKITEAVYRAIAAVNDFLPEEQALEPREDLVLLGNGARLDSMGFVNFLVSLEEELEKALGRELNIAELLSVQSSDNETTVSTVGELISSLSERIS